MAKCSEIGFAVLLKNLDPEECVQAAFDASRHLKADKTGFTLELWFCAKTLPEKGDEAVLVSGGGLSLLLSEGRLKLRFQDQLYSFLENVSVSPLLWHNAAVSFSNGALTAFYDGITVYSGDAEFSGMDIQVGQWELGNHFCGFLKGFRVFPQALSRDGLRSVLYAEPEDGAGERGSFQDTLKSGPSPAAWYVFTQNPPVEKIKQYPVVLCQASFTDVSSQIRFRGDTIFKYNDPDTAGSGSYTLLLHVYPDTPKARRQGIFSRIISQTGEKIGLHLASKGDQFYFEAQAGNGDAETVAIQSDEISTSDLCRWYTIALVLGTDSCFLWVNGKQNEVSQGFAGIESFCHMAYLGADGTENEKGLTGYISYAAEFTACLSKEQIEVYSQTPPFLFDPSIHSLFHPVQNLSAGELLREEVTGSSLESTGVAFSIADRTANYYKTGNLSYYSTHKAFSANAYEMWRTQFFCGLCELFFSSMYGIAPSSGYTEDDQLLAEAGERMAGSYARLPEFDSVLLQAGFDVTEALQNLFGCLAQSDFLHLYTRIFFMKHYLTENMLYTMSLEFLRAVFVSSQTDENYQNAFDFFAGKAHLYASEMLQHKNSYQDDTLSVRVTGASLKKDGTEVTLETTLSYKLSGESRTAKIRGWAEPICFRGSTEEGKVVFSPEQTEQAVSLIVAKPKKLEMGKGFSFSIQFEEKKQYFLDYYTR